jgi:hypothetical protein
MKSMSRKKCAKYVQETEYDYGIIPHPPFIKGAKGDFEAGGRDNGTAKDFFW